MIRIVLLLCALMSVVPPIEAQQPEWMMRIPKYFRLTGGSSQFVIDPTRNATLYDGGAYDTYATYDGGSSWESIFDIKMFFIDAQISWKIDGVGNWYYNGRVYGKLHVNLLTVDAGKTIRYLVEDTTQLPLLGRYELPLKLVMPNAVFFDVIDIESDTSKRGLYSSCDAGLTWQFTKQPSKYYTGSGMKRVAANTIVFHLDNNTFIERDLCNSTWDSTAVSIATYSYLRFADGTLLLYSPPNLNAPTRVRRVGIDKEEEYKTYRNPDNGASRRLTPTFVALHGDSMAIIIAKDGVIATYSPNVGLQFVDIPPYRNPNQQVCDAGRLGDRLLFRTVIPNGAGVDSNNRWIMLNTRTGKVSKYIRPGSAVTFALPPTQLFENQRVVPYSDSVWLASLAFGEVMRTTDAGASWTMVENMPRDERWGLNYIGTNRLYPRGDGGMAVLTERGRLMINEPETKNWSITHLGPFTHAIKTSSSSTSYIEDIYGRYRSRFGPSTVYFHSPDKLWMSGDIVTSWNAKGDFIDTVLPRRARIIKRLSETAIVASMDSVWLSFNNGREWIHISEHWPTAVYGDKTVKAALGDMIVTKGGDFIAGLRGIRLYDTLGTIVDSIPGGIIRSTDNGLTWSPGPTGIPKNVYVTSLLELPSGTLLCLAADVTIDPRTFNALNEIVRMPLAECGLQQHKFGQAYIYRSVDGGWTWTRSYIFPSREFLPLTDPSLTLMPDGRVMAINPAAGIAVSATDGVSFGVGDPLNIGNPIINDVVFTNDGWAHFATDSGYVRVRIDNILEVHEESNSIGSLRAHVNRSGVLSITCDIIPTSLRLIALDGRTVLDAFNNAKVNQLDVSSLVAGTYVVVASNSDAVRTALVQLP